MNDREKVIRGLEHCSDPYMCDANCPYYENNNAIIECTCNLAGDVLALLKEQEAEATWIYGEDETGVDGWHCSECNFFEPWFYDFTDDIDFIRFYRRCPNCGRKMTSYTGRSKTDNQR